MQLRMVQPATITGSAVAPNGDLSGEGTGTAAGAATTSEPSQPSVPEHATDEASNLISGYYDLESEVNSPAEGDGKLE